MFRLRRVSKQVKSAFVYTVASFITKGFHLITTPIFARLLTVEQNGIVANYSTWLALIADVAALGLTSAALNIALKEYKEESADYIKSAQTLVFVGAGFSCILLVVLYPLIKNILDMPVFYLGLICITVLFSSSQSFWMTQQRYEYKYKSVAFVTVLSSVLSAGLSCAAVVIAKNRGFADLPLIRIVTMTIASCATAIPFFIHFSFHRGPFLKKKYLKFCIVVCLPMVLHTLSKTVLTSADKVMINALSGTESLGYYSILYSLSSLTTIIWTSIHASLIPHIYEQLDDREKYAGIGKVTTPIMIAFAGLSVIYILFAPEIVQIIASKKYLPAVYVMPPVASSVYFIALYSLYADLLMYKKKTKYIMWSTTGVAVFNIVTNYIFIRLFGYIAAAYTTLASYIILSLVYKIISHRLMEKARVYNDRVIWIGGLIMSVLGLACTLVYEHTLLRYLLITVLALVILLVLIINRKRVLSTIQLFRKE